MSPPARVCVCVSISMCTCVYRHAKRLLVQIVERCRNGPGFHGEGEGGTAVQEMLIPASKVGLVIGRGGDTIKQLQVRRRPDQVHN